MNTIIKTDFALKGLSTPRQILQAGLKALGNGEFSGAIDQFDDAAQRTPSSLGRLEDYGFFGLSAGA